MHDVRAQNAVWTYFYKYSESTNVEIEDKQYIYLATKVSVKVMLH